MPKCGRLLAQVQSQRRDNFLFKVHFLLFRAGLFKHSHLEERISPIDLQSSLYISLGSLPRRESKEAFLQCEEFHFLLCLKLIFHPFHLSVHRELGPELPHQGLFRVRLPGQGLLVRFSRDTSQPFFSYEYCVFLKCCLLSNPKWARMLFDLIHNLCLGDILLFHLKLQILFLLTTKQFHRPFC